MGGDVMDAAFKAHFKDGYEQWAGNSQGHRPDYTRCCEEIADTSTKWTRYRQCSRKNGHGPDGAYCKTHDPAVKAAREAETRARQDEKYKADVRQRSIGWKGRQMIAALKAIENGHNDPRALAKETLDDLRKNSWWIEP